MSRIVPPVIRFSLEELGVYYDDLDRISQLLQKVVKVLKFNLMVCKQNNKIIDILKESMMA